MPKIKLINPHGRKPWSSQNRSPHAKKSFKLRPRPKAHRPARKTSNPGMLYTLGLLNPTRRSTVNKSSKKHNKSPRRPVPVVSRPKAKARNPFFAHKKKHNPNRGLAGKSVGLFKTGLLALAGMLITRQLPQFALGANNTGWIGYFSNFATAVAASMAAGKTLGKEAGNAVGIGGMLYVVNRIITEKFSPIGQALSLAGCGDAIAHGGLGRLNDIYSPMPVLRDRAGNVIIPSEIDNRAAMAAIRAAATSASRVSGLSRVGSRAA